MPVGVFNNITADSIPVLDTWGWNDYWSCRHWIKWHGAMVAKYGLKYANDKFMEYWDQQTFGSATADCRTFNSDFIAYTKKAGIYRALFDGIGLITYPMGIAAELIKDAGEIVENAADSAISLSSMLKWLVPIAVLGVGYLAFKTYMPQPKRLKQ